MATQRIIWTALPNGKEGSTRKLSVLVSPRLETPGQTTLDAFGDFREWPGKALTFTLKFETEPPGTSKVVTVAAPPGPPERADLWKAAFPKETTVEGHEFPDYSGLAVHSVPVLNVLSFISGQYQKVASAVNTASHFPHVAQLTGAGGLQQIGFGWELIGKTSRPRDGEPEVSKQLKQLLGKNKAVPPAAPNPPLDFWQVKELVRPRNATKQITLPGGYTTSEYVQFFPPAQVPKPDIDFHKAIALLGEHSKLLRVLGLIIDLEVTESVPTSGFVWVEDVQAEPSWELEPVDVRPKTRYTADFLAQPDSNALAKGFLAVEQGYGLVEVDVQGAALKLMNLTNTMLASLHPARNTADTPSRFSLPALRSGGLQLVRTGRAANLVSRLNRSKSLNSDAVKATPTQSQLFAEDVVRGYAVDVKDASAATNPWHSLCLRRVSYALGKPGFQEHWPADPTQKLDDEGWTSMGTTSGPDRSISPDLTLTEEMFRWDGWSLCARRPGKSVGTDDKPADFANEPDELQVVVDAEVMAGSLPRLRFGRKYLVRARAVDLAGNSLAHTYDGPDSKIGPKLYSRFEPVAHPAIVPQQKSGPGESIQRLVIRSFNDAPGKDTVKTAEQTGRHLAPPLGSALLAETHGKLDTMTSAQSYALTKSRQGSYEDPKNPTAAEVPHPETQLPLPYFPDPLGHGVSFLGLPLDEIDRFLGLPGAPLNKQTEYHADGSKTVTDLNPTEKPPISLIQVDFGPIEKWPDLQTFTLLVVDGTAEPAWDEKARRLTVFVPKAETARVRVSSYIGDEAFPLLGIWQWIEETQPPAAVKKRLQQLALQGRHWMLTPFRDLVLVHAVQQPLLTPDISKLAVTRELGSTAAVLKAEVGVHAKSTGKLDLNAAWTEPVDPLTEPKPKSISGQAHAFEVPIAYPGLPEQPSDNIASVAHRHELGDTKHRDITYQAVASTRYREYFNDDTLDFTRTTKDVSLHVPSSARPEAPRIMYIVPTFGWERPPASATEMRSTRSGGGLRIYLERPWYSSGDNELLGVVLPQVVPQRGGGGRKMVAKLVAPTIPDALKPYVSQWGGDPIAGSPVAKPVLGPADFPRLKEDRAKLTLEEIDGHTVRVAAHAVEYDERRQLWYCDIELNPGPAYFPFVRLALARYQPWSVEVPAAPNRPLQNVHLSRIVLAEFTQLAPDRTATVTTESDTKLAVAVAGVGVQGNAVVLQVETQRHDLPTDLGWVPAQNARVDQLLTAVAKGPKRFEVTLPAPRGSMPLRLVIREYEEYPSSFDGKENTLSRRLVYAEVFEL